MAEAGAKKSVVRLLEMGRESRQLFPTVDEDGLLDFLMKAVDTKAESKQGVAAGRQDHPFNFANVINFKNGNIHHSTCLETKTASTVGLGFRTDKMKMNPMTGLEEPDHDAMSRVDEELNPLCDVSFVDVLTDVAEDFWATGNGYMEVVRDRPGGKILRLYHVPAATVYVNIESRTHDRHFEVVAGEGFSAIQRFARFGDGEAFLARAGGDLAVSPEELSDDDRVSELIHFRRPSSLSRWYGFPEWLAAVPSVELVQCLTQQTFDFFLNRGVAEFMLFLLGKELGNDDWEKVEIAMRANIGLGNSHKSIALNIQDPEMTVQLEKLGLDSKSDGGQFTNMSDTLAMQIVSAHRVPPLLAGIQIPGKLGATNELPNALMAFQALVVGQAQKTFSTILGNTLGQDPSVSLGVDDFAFRKITDIINMDKMDTVSRMRQTVPEAEGEGRNLDEGLKKMTVDEEMIGKILSAVFEKLIA
jgi:capsid portal protein